MTFKISQKDIIFFFKKKTNEIGMCPLMNWGGGGGPSQIRDFYA